MGTIIIHNIPRCRYALPWAESILPFQGVGCKRNNVNECSPAPQGQKIIAHGIAMGTNGDATGMNGIAMGNKMVTPFGE